MAVPAVTAVGSRAVKCCGTGRVDVVSMVVGAGDVNTDCTIKSNALDANSQKTAFQIGFVGGSSTKTGGATQLTFKSQNPLDNTTKVIGYMVIASGVALDKDLKNQIVDGIATLPGEALLCQSDVAITVIFNLVKAATLQVLSTT